MLRPHLSDDKDNAAGSGHIHIDPVIRKYAHMSWRGFQASFVVVAAWALTFLIGGKQAGAHTRSH